MKKFILFALLFFIADVSFSQKSERQIASNFLKDGKLDEALTRINNCINDPTTASDSKTWFIRGNILLEINNSNNNNYSSLDANSLEHAVESYKKSFEVDPKKVFFDDIFIKLNLINNKYYNKAVEFYNLKDFKNAMINFEKGVNSLSVINIPDTVSLFYAAICATKSNDINHARNLYLTLLNQNAKSVDIYSSLTDIYCQIKDYENALKYINLGRQLYPGNNKLFLAETNIYLSFDQKDKAISYLKSAMLVEPNNWTIYFSLGAIYDNYANDSQRPEYERKNFFNLARDQYLSALNYKPDFFDANYNLGALYFNQAAELIAKSSALPISAEESYKAMIAQANSLFYAALPYLETALEIQPTDQSVMYSLKQIYSRLNISNKLNALNSNNLSFISGNKATSKTETNVDINTNVQQVNEAAKGQFKPPVLKVASNSVKIIDPDGNKVIDGNSGVKIIFDIINEGEGDAKGVVIRTNATENIIGLTFNKETYIGTIPSKLTQSIELPIAASDQISDGKIIFSLFAKEENGFDSDPVTVEIMTRKFLNPVLKLVDFEAKSEDLNGITKKKPFELQLLIQNIGQGVAVDMEYKIQLPAMVFCTSGELNGKMAKVEPGESNIVTIGLIASNNYQNIVIPLQVTLSEKSQKYGDKRTIELKMNETLAENRTMINIQGTMNSGNNKTIQVASLKSDVDIDIPSVSETKPSSYALVIGEEDYSSYQQGLNIEVNVDYAKNDAIILKEYLTKTIGIPEKQVKLLLNATASQILQGLIWLQNLCKAENGNAELIFYYSGHGLPDEKNREPYLIPVDVSGLNIEQGIKLSVVLQKLSEHPSRKVTVILDACFSGGARNQGLTAMKSVKVKPKSDILPGNIVLFSSSSGEESSGIYREKQHGFFTYFLLKKIQESKGNITYKALADYIQKSVVKESSLISKPQTPQFSFSNEVSQLWENWYFK